MTEITFLRLRPAERINELWAATRRREGATAAEVVSLSAADRAGALAGGLGPVSVGPSAVAALAWVATPEEALDLHAEGIPGWRITVRLDGSRRHVLDALARTGARFLRAGRSRVAAATQLAAVPAVETTVSTFVDTTQDAVCAVEDGATDLLLRGWDTESIADLRIALAEHTLVERTALPPGTSIDVARDGLDDELFTAYLDQIDGGGAARPRYRWAPGMAGAAPVPAGRFSAQWADPRWTGKVWSAELEGQSDDIRTILEASLAGTAPDRGEVERLFRARGDEVEAVAWTADRLRERVNGDIVTYVVNRNINYTNQCYFRCGFCAFSKGPRSLNFRGEPYLMNVAQVVERAAEAAQRGASEVCLQGGIHPDFTGDFYVTVVESIKDVLPDMHIHGFTPLEVWQGAETLGTSVSSFLRRLRDAGLGTLPGTAAEILDDDVRAHLCPDKIRTAEWADVMITAHELGLRSTATMMFGHIDSPHSWANHFEVLREIQRRTGGITEFVPLPFVHMGAPIYLRGRSRPGPTWDEVVLVHAVARVAFDGLIPNVQASWVKLGLDAGSRLLDAGCNDLGGTLMDETISRSAGASHGTTVEPADLEDAIRGVGRAPQRRTTLYEVLDTDRVGGH
jgi:FO synthase